MTEPNTTKIDNLLRSLLSGAQDRDADTPKRRERGAARFDKAYAEIIAYVAKLEADVKAYRASGDLARELAKQQAATIKALRKEAKG